MKSKKEGEATMPDNYYYAALYVMMGLGLPRSETERSFSKSEDEDQTKKEEVVEIWKSSIKRGIIS